MKAFVESNSQAYQEAFVLNMLNWKKNGFYVEIGAYSSWDGSNTLCLEKFFDWKGISLEIEQYRSDEFNANRKNPCFCLDALNIDYETFFKDHDVPEVIDYLQLDIEPAINTLAALKKMPFNKHRFSVITFEHDLYFDPENYKVQNESQAFLKSLGYELVIENLAITGNVYEDWYIHPDEIKKDIWTKAKAKNIEYTDVFDEGIFPISSILEKEGES
jgi:hypothetical protein